MSDNTSLTESTQAPFFHHVGNRYALSRTEAVCYVEAEQVDEEFAETLKQVDAARALQAVAKHPRIVEAVRLALEDHDKHAGKGGWSGPSRTQAVRGAIVEALQVEA